MNPDKSGPVIIEVAINGPTTKERNPNVPITPAEISAEAIQLIGAGAAIIHNHIEDFTLVGEAAGKRYGEGWAPVLAKYPDAILCPTGVAAPTIQQKVAHNKPCAAQGARMGVFDPGSVNLSSTLSNGAPGERRFPYNNTLDDIDVAFAELDAARLGASLGIYEPSFLRATLAYHRAGKLPRGTLVKLYFGGEYDFIGDGRRPKNAPAVSFGLQPTHRALDAYLEMMVGSNLTWSAAVLGGDALEAGMVRLALEHGGHIRVGLEDFGGDGTPTNMQILEGVLAECRAVGRPPATCAEAAKILDLPRAVSAAA